MLIEEERFYVCDKIHTKKYIKIYPIKYNRVSNIFRGEIEKFFDNVNIFGDI